MKQVKIFFDPSDTAVNNWISQCYQKAEEATAGNVPFIVHDIKMSSFSRGEELRCDVMVIYEYKAD